MECRCDDRELTELYGDEAADYASHLDKVAEERLHSLKRCPRTGVEWVEDWPLDPAATEWVGTCRLRRFPPRPPDIANPS